MKKLIIFISALVALPLVASAATFTQTLTLGSRGSQVVQLQTLLANAGFFHATATGYFGPLTQKAVMQFQNAHGLDPVGIVGPKTRAALNGSAGAQGNIVPITQPTAIQPVTTGGTHTTVTP